jgi:regulator of protease activity HflC (stomatin/prohibitin superfamily)
MDIFEIGLVLLILACLGYMAIWLLSLRQIVDIKYADVVVRTKGTSIYSADTEIPEREPSAVYYNIPAWVPIYGVIVKRMPLEIMQIPVKGYETFAKSNARFVIDVSVYCRIISVKTAAQKFPGTSIEDFKKGMSSIIVSAVRKTTANYAIEDIISKRKEIGDEIHNEIREDFAKWGVELTNVAVENIADAPNTTVIHDISAKKEAEINSLSRQEIAIKSKQAEIIEAENRELAEKRKIQADEQIAIRGQEKEKTVATMKQEAITKILDVERNEKVTRAGIEADAKIRTAEGTRQAQIVTSEGQRNSQILISEGEKAAFELKGTGQAAGEKAIGMAKAEVIKSTKLAEAEGFLKMAQAQAAQQEGAEKIRLIEKDEKIGIAMANALAQADIKFYGGGDPKNFMDLFKPGTSITAGGGVATFMEILKNNDPETYNKAMGVLDAAKDKIRGETTEPKKSLPSVESVKKNNMINIEQMGISVDAPVEVKAEVKSSDIKSGDTETTPVKMKYADYSNKYGNY